MPDLAGDKQSAPWPRWKTTIVLLAFLTAPMAIPIVPVVAFLVYESVSQQSFYTRTPFVADLPGPTISDQQRHFAQRVGNTFSVGMPIGELERRLIAEGFSPSMVHAPDENHLHIEHGIFPCLMGWDVLWTASFGKISAAHGEMTATCL